MLGEVAWRVTRSRDRCARSSNASAPAAAKRSPRPPPARKLCVLLWQMLTRGEDYAF